MANLKAKRTIAILMENKGASVSGAMREAGYKPKYAKNPQTFLKSKMAQKELKPIIERLEAERDAALNEMAKKRKGAKYNELNAATNDLSKTSQLLGGGATERIVITDKEKEAVDKAFEENS